MEELVGLLMFFFIEGSLIFLGCLLLNISRNIRSARKLDNPERYQSYLSLLSVILIIFAVVFKIAIIAILSGEMRPDDGGPFFFSMWGAGNVILLLIAGVTLWNVKERVGRQLSIEEAQFQERRVDRARISGWALIVWPLIVLVLPSLVLLVLFLVVWQFIIVGKRRSDQGMVLWTLAVSVAKGLPLAKELEILADGLSGGHRDKVRKLADLLHEGIGVAAALEIVPTVVPRFAILAAQVGTENNTLAKSLREAAVSHASHAQGVKRRTFSPTLVMMYIFVIPSVMMTIATGIMIWIIPKFKKIFEGFNMDLPDQTITYINASDFVAEYFYLIMPLPPLLVIFLFWKNFQGWGESDIPFVGRWFRRLDLPEILRHLAHSIRAGKPIVGALDVIKEKHRRKAVRIALHEVHSKCRQGDDCWYAMRDTGLLTSQEVAVLRSSQRVGNLSWALSELAETIERRTGYRWMTIWEFAQPVIVLLIGAVVLWTCLAFFMPLVELLNNIA